MCMCICKNKHSANRYMDLPHCSAFHYFLSYHAHRQPLGITSCVSLEKPGKSSSLAAWQVLMIYQ